ncbi:MAG: twin-arginine translocation signal domain-containing protein [Acidobacteria bacterium]|nr:twin-arginine translocation signal domain-containing protein [Acidobacteriota bacterium]
MGDSTLSRRDILKSLAAAGGCAMLPAISTASPASHWRPKAGDEAFLDDLQRQACLFFWEQASEKTGQVLDRARNDLNGKLDPRRMASIAATGFGLTALCIADKRKFLPHDQIVERVRITLDWHLNKLPEVHGFYYHFCDIETGERTKDVELSSVDSTWLLCGVLMTHAYFDDAKIKSLAKQIYERVDWPWMLNGGKTFSMGWKPESGFLDARWEHYCELMMIYLLAIGSPTHPVSPDTWKAWERPVVHYKEFSFISGNDPLFTHQWAQAWCDFRNKRDEWANYFANSVTATKAHKAFCLSYPKWYNEDYWGISASDYQDGYTAWGGPPPQGPLDGTVVPCAAAGSLAFLPVDCIAVLRAMRDKWGKQAWGRYGFVDAFHPAANWYDSDVLGIDQGVSVLMAENLRSGLVWNTFMRNPEITTAMQRAGFRAS